MNGVLSDNGFPGSQTECRRPLLGFLSGHPFSLGQSWTVASQTYDSSDLVVLPDWPSHLICSFEHVKLRLFAMPKEFPREQLRSVFQLIRERADYALRLLMESDEVRALSWRCLVCGHTKKFTRPVPREVANPCPKCKSTDFVAE